MKILLGNDDGFGADGIVALEKELEKHGHDIWVCAPSEQRSGFSHAITVARPLEIKKISPRHYTCSGSPADCVMYFIEANRAGKFEMGEPDVVISGINWGYNMGRDLLYSGTVGCASEAALLGIPSVAVSAEITENPPYEDAALFTALHLEEFFKTIGKGSFLTINVPTGSRLEWMPTVVDMTSYYINDFEIRDETIVMTGRGLDSLKKRRREAFSEVEAVWFHNKISVAGVKALPRTDLRMYRSLENLAT